MKKVLICLALLYLALPVFAANWQQYAPKGWYDISSWRYDGSVVSVWFKDLNPGNWKLKDNKKIWYNIVYMQADCNLRQINVKSFATYDTKGDLIDSATFSFDDWQDVIPETVGEVKYNLMCSQ